MLLVLTFNYENIKHFTQHQGDLIVVCTVLGWPRTAIDIFANNFLMRVKIIIFTNILIFLLLFFHLF